METKLELCGISNLSISQLYPTQCCSHLVFEVHILDIKTKKITKMTKANIINENQYQHHLVA